MAGLSSALQLSSARAGYAQQKHVAHFPTLRRWETGQVSLGSYLEVKAKLAFMLASRVSHQFNLCFQDSGILFGTLLFGTRAQKITGQTLTWC